LKSLKKKSEKGYLNLKRIDDKIGEKVHKLYGITDEEKKLIEDSLK